MKLNCFTKLSSAMGRWFAMALLCVSAIAFVWQGAFFSSTTAMAAPNTSMLTLADAGSQVQGKASEDAGRAKSFVRNTADRLEQTAKKNAERVDRATDDEGGFVERKAKRDAARIEERSERDAARTQKAIDNTKNVVERAVDNIKDAFGN
jgi:hypothetical protein